MSSNKQQHQGQRMDKPQGQKEQGGQGAQPVRQKEGHDPQPSGQHHEERGQHHEEREQQHQGNREQKKPPM